MNQARYPNANIWFCLNLCLRLLMYFQMFIIWVGNSHFTQCQSCLWLSTLPHDPICSWPPLERSTSLPSQTYLYSKVLLQWISSPWISVYTVAKLVQFSLIGYMESYFRLNTSLFNSMICFSLMHSSFKAISPCLFFKFFTASYLPRKN